MKIFYFYTKISRLIQITKPVRQKTGKNNKRLFPIHSHFRKYSPLHFMKRAGAALVRTITSNTKQHLRNRAKLSGETFPRVFWACKNEHPYQTIDFTKTAGQHPWLRPFRVSWPEKSRNLLTSSAFAIILRTHADDAMKPLKCLSGSFSGFGETRTW